MIGLMRALMAGNEAPPEAFARLTLAPPDAAGDRRRPRPQ